MSKNGNYGGGGGGTTSSYIKYIGCGGGGGSYGTIGKAGSFWLFANKNCNIEQGLINKQARRARRLNSGNKLQGINGMCYGTNKMILSDSNNSDSHSIDTCDIYLGSGGGAGYQNKGTAGGGAIIIECENGIFIGEKASIIADGENSLDTYDSGCGGGGSIYIKTNTIVNNGIISAIGGINANGLNGCGSGGMGRIRIDCAGDKLEPTGNEKGIIRPRVGYSEVSKTRVS